MSIDYEGALYWKERTLHLILALDKVRDSVGDDEDPHLMFHRIVALLKDQLNAEACAIALVADTNDHIEFVANDGFDDADATHVCLQALSRAGTGPVTCERWAHTMGIRVVLRDKPLAGLVLARQSTPFTVEETGLLSIAESQIDSAVMQARTVGKLKQRNRELEVIYEIDRLRDDALQEADLIARFTSLLIDELDASFCMVFIGYSPSGDLIVRGEAGNPDVSQAALDTIRASASEIDTLQTIPAPDALASMALLAAPFEVAGTRFGALVVGRDTPFTKNDHRLLYAMMSQMDSAIARVRSLRPPA